MLMFRSLVLSLFGASPGENFEKVIDNIQNYYVLVQEEKSQQQN